MSGKDWIEQGFGSVKAGASVRTCRTGVNAEPKETAVPATD